ncbi:MAG: hypothetical protein RBR26_06740 [Methanosarcina mazei]|jgi:ABC-type transport system involved in multi-copper enzyme maturation permease subunit|nr:hypothetical protein [Methanosarcina mazei]
MNVPRFFRLVGNEIERMAAVKNSLLVIFTFIILLLMQISTIFTKDLGPEAMTFSTIISALILMVVGIVVFSCPAFSSDFENKSFIFIVSKPIKRTTYYWSKATATLLVQTLTISVFSLVSMILIMIASGSFPVRLFIFLLMAIAMNFFLNGMALLFSSIINKNVISIILFFIGFGIIAAVGLSLPDNALIKLLPNYSTLINMIGVSSPLEDVLMMTLKSIVFLLGLGIILNYFAAVLYSKREV